MTVFISRLAHSDGLPLPEYSTEHSAGVDLRAAIPDDEPMVIEPGARTLVPTGLRIALPSGYEAQVRPRSGLALKHGVTVLNTPGTIDADYRGEVMVILANLGTEAFVVHRGERIAQMVIGPYTRVNWTETDSLDETDRGSGGFGHTGKS